MNAHPDFRTNWPSSMTTMVAQMSVRQRSVCEYDSQVVIHSRLLTVCLPGDVYGAVRSHFGGVGGVVVGLPDGDVEGFGDGFGDTVSVEK
ncbi:hypothetical protein H5392_10760 [Tessaracoccus sp. MC1865]|uniref:hypothetical protein n=1 Tax=Tessaracoccus sp. MC1865 TaxID=2760310 RepID=UPI0015FF96A8|nr:hypothetical protein [Tessaracoccus sp. MC1865]MBB1484338.1 hypothetical protein [Tessaracoccus sp. MC1865]QTO38548.1 hypothetical protein J7D54_05555 [Tessaracoccus sp. MC1865]